MVVYQIWPHFSSFINIRGTYHDQGWFYLFRKCSFSPVTEQRNILVSWRKSAWAANALLANQIMVYLRNRTRWKYPNRSTSSGWTNAKCIEHRRFFKKTNGFQGKMLPSKFSVRCLVGSFSFGDIMEYRWCVAVGWWACVGARLRKM